MNLRITKEDLLRDKAVKPGVYVLLIKNITDGPGKNDPQATVTTVDLTVESGPDEGAIGVPVKFWISEKYMAGATSFIEAVTGKKTPATGIEITDEQLKQCIGRKVKAYIKNEMYNNRPTNKIDGFMSV